MFSIIISEKGGAERRESFDKNEINVGRVQGNDLMLPKGNVSKHHARLLFRDGRFIVTDLKSTNGTYVNGRKIAQATIVREGDKIYIGDFVLRLETNGQGAPAPEATSSEEESIRTLARDRENQQGSSPGPTAAPPPQPRPPPPAVTLKAPTHPPGAPLPRPQPQNVSNAPTPGVAIAPIVAPPAASPPAQQAYGQDSDPDDSAPLKKPSNPPAPLALGGVGGPRPMTMPLNQMSPPAIGQRPPGATPAPGQGPPPLPIPIVAQPLAPPPRAPETSAPPQPQPSLHTPSASAPPSMRASAPPPRIPPKETPAQAGRRLALMTLLDRVSDAIDLSVLRQNPVVTPELAQQIERACRDQANAMRQEGDAPEGIDLDTIVRDAHRELVGLGAFGPLLEDEEVLEINCPRFDQVFTLRGTNVSPEATAFSSEEALYRVIARLAQQSGEPWRQGETVVERRLARANFVAVAPPAASSHVVCIRKRRRVESSLEDLVRIGSMGKPMAQFLEACVAGRASVLVSGTTPMPMLSALASSLGGGERVVIVQDVEEIAAANANAISLTIADTRKLGEECVRAAAKLHPDRLIVSQLAGGVAAATVDAMAEGTEGVLAAMTAPTLRQALSRLVAQLVLHRPGLSLEGMRDVVGESFDVAIEVSSLPDGRLRVMRIAELGGSDPKGIVARDVFVWSADPQGGEGSFGATGVVPRIANDLASRGIKLDPTMWKRGGR